jgi:hypothetical protein
MEALSPSVQPLASRGLSIFQICHKSKSPLTAHGSERSWAVRIAVEELNRLVSGGIHDESA